MGPNALEVLHHVPVLYIRAVAGRRAVSRLIRPAGLPQRHWRNW